ncbi:hypothetical protein TNCV_1397981 [Trichonephila clavipes]|nr:hypothetical protein TNCV_1397981 [Trichonephila clavipes]
MSFEFQKCHSEYMQGFHIISTIRLTSVSIQRILCGNGWKSSYKVASRKSITERLYELWGDRHYKGFIRRQRGEIEKDILFHPLMLRNASTFGPFDWLHIHSGLLSET